MMKAWRNGNRPLLTYFILVFLIAWGAVIIVVGPQGLRGEATPTTEQLLPVFGAMLLGPAVAGIALTYGTGGKKALGELWQRQQRWHVGARWYAIALFTTPVLILAILLPLSLHSPVFIPSILAGDVSEVIVFGIIFGVFAGIFEEIGWTGFTLPRMQTRNTLLKGLFLGLIWGAWHILADYWGAHASFGVLWVPRILLWILALTAYRILMAWVYEKTESLVIAQMMHASFTGSQMLVPSLSSTDHFLWYSLFTVALWALVLALYWKIQNHAVKS